MERKKNPTFSVRSFLQFMLTLQGRSAVLELEIKPQKLLRLRPFLVRKSCTDSMRTPPLAAVRSHRGAAPSSGPLEQGVGRVIL